MSHRPDSHVIVLRGNPMEEHGLASGTMIPGHLVEPTGSGKQFQKQNTQGAGVAALFVREQWENNGAGIDETIASGDSISVVRAQKGDVILCITAATIDRGEYVTSAGDGTVEVADSAVAFGQALDATYDHGALLRVPVLII
jgi:hypothetical protein